MELNKNNFSYLIEFFKKIEPTRIEAPNDLKRDILDIFHKMGSRWQEFEEIIKEITIFKGYRDVQTTRHRDGGKDVTATLDNGYDHNLQVMIEAKAYAPTTQIKPNLIHSFRGKVVAYGYLGIFITTGSVSYDTFLIAKELKPAIIIVDGSKLANILSEIFESFVKEGLL